MDYKNVKEIEELIEEGFNLELISLELGIPIEIVKNCEIKMKTPKSNKKQTNPKVTSKMDRLREKYKELYYGKNSSAIEKISELTNEQIEFIESVIKKCQNEINEIKEDSKSERRKAAWNIIKEINKIQALKLTIEQAQKIRELLNSEKLRRIDMNSTDRMYSDLYTTKKRITIMLANAYDIEQSKTKKLEELEKLQREMKKEFKDNNQMSVIMIQNKIAKRIEEIKKQEMINKIKNEISEDVEKIIVDLSSGELDVEKANKIIKTEAQKRVEQKTKNKFSLTEAQEKNQIRIQIKKALREQSEKYNIENPEVTIQQLTVLLDGNLGEAIGVVGENCVKNKQFENARGIYDKYREKNRDIPEKSYIKRLREDIRKAEIAEMILKVINNRGTVEEENKAFNLIEEGLNRGNVKPGTIYLGKNIEGTRSITLADIIEPEQMR